MWAGLGLDRQLARYIIDVILQDREIKAELAKQIRTESEPKNKYSQYSRANFDELTRGDVNLQMRLTQSGYDVYGRTYIQSNAAVYSNANSYRKMKNKIRYGRRPEDGFENKGSFTVG